MVVDVMLVSVIEVVILVFNVVFDEVVRLFVDEWNVEVW